MYIYILIKPGSGVPLNVSCLYNLGSDTLWKPQVKIAWVSAVLHGWLKVLVF